MTTLVASDGHAAVSDLAVRAKVYAFHKGEGRPRVRRMIYTPTSDRKGEHRVL